MSHTPPPIHDAAAEFDALPGVGPRAALRYAYWLVTQPKERIRAFARALLSLADSITTCQTCGVWTENSPCSICQNPKREKSTLCVVATSQELHVIEDSGAFHGTYHILGGLLDPIEGRTPETLAIDTLLARLSSASSTIREVILAFDPDVRGDTTALYLQNRLANLPLKVSRLARGLPHGAQIEYADHTTVADAFTNRRGA